MNMYDQQKDSNNFNDERNVKPVQERPQRRNPDMTKTENDRSTKDQSTRTTGVDSVKHQIGPDSTYARLEQLNV